MNSWESKPNWQFVLIPIEGDPDLEINGDIRPTGSKSNSYQFNSVAVDAEERVVITNQKCQELKIGCQKFFLKVSTTSEKPASFLLFASAGPRSDQINLDLNTPYNGSVVKGEVINFIVQLNPDIPQKLKAHVDLISNPGGNADLYVMDCVDRASCFIDKSMIMNAKELSQDKDKYFRYSAEVGDSDSVKLRFMIKPSEAEIPSGNKKYYSMSNLIAVAVVGNSINQSEIEKDQDPEQFQLQFSTHGFESLLTESNIQRVVVTRGNRQTFVFNSLRPIDQVSELQFLFKVFSGDVTIFMKKGRRPEDDDDYDDKREINNNELEMQALVGKFRLTKTEDGESIPGKHFI